MPGAGGALPRLGSDSDLAAAVSNARLSRARWPIGILSSPRPARWAAMSRPSSAAIGILAQVDIGRTRGQGGGPSGRRGDLQRPVAGPDHLVQLALSPLGLAEDMADPGGEEALACRRALADGWRQQSLGFGR